MGKKAQVTIFIILGIVLLLGIGVFFFVRTRQTRADVVTEIPGKVQYAGQAELRNFMDTCIREAAFHAIEIVRLQAGYIDIPSGIKTVRVKNEQNEGVVLRDGIKRVEINPNSQGNLMAYWLDSDNRLSAPTQEGIEEEIAEYVKESIERCIDNFEVFRQQNYEITAGELDVKTELSDEVLLRIEYPLTFERDNVRFEEKEFILRVPVNLKKTIDMSAEILIGEYVENFLEEDVKFLLSLYQYEGGEGSNFGNAVGDASAGLPSKYFNDVNVDCQMATWTLDQVEGMLKNNFASNFKYIGIKGYGEKIPSTTNAVIKGTHEAFTHELIYGDHEDAEVDFVFNPDEEMFVDVQPRKGNLIKPYKHTATGLPMLPLFCDVEYKFKYTLKFPVFTTVKDKESFALDVLGRTMDTERNFEFSFPMGVYICGNQDRKCVPRPELDAGAEVINSSEFEEYVPVETMFCDEKMKLSQPMKIRVVDADTLKEVKDAPVFYRCGGYENECLIGIADEDGYVESRMPLCVNGQLYTLLQDYSDSAELLTTQQGEDVKQLDFFIEPLKELEVEVELVDAPLLMGNYYMSQGFSTHRCTGAKIELNDESIGVTDIGDKNVMMVSNYGPNSVYALYPESRKIKLAPGKYSLGFIVEGEVKIDPVTIAGRTLTANSDGSSPYQGSFLLGNYPNMEFEITKGELKDAKKIIFYVPIETTSERLDILDLPQSIQADGSLYKEGLMDTDCDPNTDPEMVEITMSREAVAGLLKPRLE